MSFLFNALLHHDLHIHILQRFIGFYLDNIYFRKEEINRREILVSSSLYFRLSNSVLSYKTIDKNIYTIRFPSYNLLATWQKLDNVSNS